MKSSALVAGGACYIGSHATLAFFQTGHWEYLTTSAKTRLNLCDGYHRFLAGRRRLFAEISVRRSVLADRPIGAVLYFSGLKALGERVQRSSAYYRNNITGTLALYQTVADASVYQLVFSSSVAVYGEPPFMRISENSTMGAPTNSYGRSWHWQQANPDGDR